MTPADASDPEESIPVQVTSAPPRYSPYSPGHPERAPLIFPVIGSSSLYRITQPSQPPTPGLTADELKCMLTEWNSAAKIAQLVEDALDAFTKENVPSNEVLDWLKETFKSTLANQARSYFTLTEKDSKVMLPKGLSGPVNFNLHMLSHEWPEQFFTGLNLLRNILSRKVEAGCRPVIAWYLAQAVDCARRIFDDPRLTVHSEVQVPSVPIPDVGLVGEFFMDEDDGRHASINQTKPSFIIVEVKRSSTLKDYSSEAELIGQLKCHGIRTGTMTHYGALTDGRDWRFYVVDDDTFFMKSISADSHDNIILILGILTHLCAGRFPVRDNTAAIWY